ncbi:hypothetical protein VZH09_13940 (plasmid) [Synechococcus elongatus IITB7]|uniref:hypothetical protein n=1 Tax=Synechococcus elongatus TaxID=32046 RepID=UPI0030CEAFFB
MFNEEDWLDINLAELPSLWDQPDEYCIALEAELSRLGLDYQGPDKGWQVCKTVDGIFICTGVKLYQCSDVVLLMLKRAYLSKPLPYEERSNRIRLALKPYLKAINNNTYLKLFERPASPPAEL